MKKPAFYYAEFVALRLDLAVKALNEALNVSGQLTDPLLRRYLSKLAKEATVALRQAQACFEDEKLLSASQLELAPAELPKAHLKNTEPDGLTDGAVKAIEHLDQVLQEGEGGVEA